MLEYAFMQRALVAAVLVGVVCGVLGFFVIGSLVRNVRVGLFAAGALGFCGILGAEYWIETARTIGFIVAVGRRRRARSGPPSSSATTTATTRWSSGRTAASQCSMRRRSRSSAMPSQIGWWFFAT